MDLENPGTNPNSNSTPKLPLLTMVAPMFHPSPVHSGISTPPLRPTASIPFQWEEHPGKPRPCTSLVPFFTTNNEPRCLELPPRLMIQETHKNIPTKNSSPSPSTVLGGPYVSRSSRFISSSFRLFRERQGSFDSMCSSKSPEEDEDRALRGDFFGSIGVFGSDEIQKLQEEKRGFLGSWKRRKIPRGRGRNEIGSASFVYRSSSSSSMQASNRFWNWDDDAVVGHMKSNRISHGRKNGSFSLAKSQFWAAVYEGIKHVIPWKRKNS